MITLIIPFYNESKRLDRFEEGLNQYKNRNQLIQEIILVNDGSTDDTLPHLQKFQKQFSEKNSQIIHIEKIVAKAMHYKQGFYKHNTIGFCVMMRTYLIV